MCVTCNHVKVILVILFFYNNDAVTWMFSQQVFFITIYLTTFVISENKFLSLNCQLIEKLTVYFILVDEQALKCTHRRTS